MDLYRYMSNSREMGYSIGNSYNALLNEFERGNITYPRSDGFRHMMIQILNEDKMNRDVVNIIHHSNNSFKKGENYIEGDFFMLNRVLKLSTPGSLYSDYEMVKKNRDIDENYVDLMFGIKQAKEYKKNDIIIDVDDFDFNDMLRDTYSRDIEFIER